MSDKTPSRGFSGAVLKLLRAGDYRLTVTRRREITPHYLRLSFDGGGLLTDRPLHPTMWIRMWFADGDKQHQRGYTLVDPDPQADTVDIDFALHDGVASRTAQDARLGDTIEVTVLGSNFTRTTSNCRWREARTWCGWTARTAARRWCRRSARRRSTLPTTSAGWPATTESPARRPRSSARSTPSRASRLRRKRVGWHDRLVQPHIFGPLNAAMTGTAA